MSDYCPCPDCGLAFGHEKATLELKDWRDERIFELEAELRLLMARCPQCGQNALQLSAQHASIHGAPIAELRGEDLG